MQGTRRGCYDRASRCDAVGVANFALVLLVLLLIWLVVSGVRRRSHQIVAKRGLSIGADLGSLGDKPRVRVRAVTKAGADCVHLILTPETGPESGLPSPDLDLVVSLHEDEFGYELLHQWKRDQSLLAIVMPPDSRIVRLRSVQDLQPLTLRRIDER